METKIIAGSEKTEWNKVVASAFQYDFYHCNAYNHLDQTGSPFLFVARDASDFIALPLIKREIEETKFFDCTSVWGYPGPVASKRPLEIKPALIHYFQNNLNQYMHDERIISVFSRMHTIIPQEMFFKNMGTITTLNKTVAIDLKLPVEIQRQQYRKSNKSEINQLRKKGYRVKKAETEQEINAFYDIYIETMTRVNASSFYFDSFNSEYFHKLLSLDDAKPTLLLALKDDEIIAGGVFIATKSFMQYHVAGTREEYIKAAPMKLIIDEARLLAVQLGLEYLHLGGGLNGSDADSLFRFKAGFSDITFTYKTWKCIVDQEEYENMAYLKSKEKALNENFFPLYRA
jgi:lipid II:glycine glycyltransferase (peptidoglycan interpeptide bridge formation enzyme)